MHSHALTRQFSGELTFEKFYVLLTFEKFYDSYPFAVQILKDENSKFPKVEKFSDVKTV